MFAKEPRARVPASLRPLAYLTLMLATASAHAVQREWVDINGGLFNDAANWSPTGGPRDSDVLLFKLGATAATRYTVGNVKGEIDRLLVGNDALTLDFNSIDMLRLRNTNTTTPGLLIGQGGSGNIADLELTNGGSLVAHEAVLADEDGIIGRLSAHGTAITMSRHLVAGKRGSGSVTLDGGANLEVGGDGVLGEQAIGAGSVLLRGEGTRWRNTGDIAIGFRGTGTSSVLEGADVIGSNNTLLGHQRGARGELIVRGTGSSWTTGEMHVGYFGSGTLTLDAGATLASRVGVLGTMAGADGSAVIDGAQSHWSTDTMLAGYAGRGTLSITNGGTLSNRFAYVGDQVGGDGRVTVSGADSLWTSDELLNVGQRSKGVLNILAGGTVTANAASLGELAGSNGTVNVDGADALFEVENLLEIGAEGSGTLRVGGGAKVNSGPAQLGAAAQSTGTVLVEGQQSLWTVHGALEIATHTGSHATLDIREGGQVVSDSGLLSYHAGDSATVSIDGADSSWTTGSLRLGVGEGAATLNVTRGGTVSATVFSSSRASEVNLDGGTLRVIEGEIFNMVAYQSTHLRSGGGTFDTVGSRVNILLDSSLTGTGTLTKTGTGVLGLGAINEHTGNTVVRGGELRIAGGGRTSTAAVTIADADGSNAILEVNGAHARLHVSGGLLVGERGNGTLRIVNGAKVFSQFGAVSDQRGANGSVFVSNANSLWETTGTLTIGSRSVGTLTVEKGGTLTSGDAALGQFATGAGTVRVRGANSSWSNTHDLLLGAGGQGSMVVESGARVSNTNASLGERAGSRGEVTVSGAHWVNRGDINIGRVGQGVLTVRDGGTVSNTFALLGNEQGGSGTVRVEGADSAWLNSGSLFVGFSGRGRVEIVDGGRVDSFAGYLGLSGGSAGEVQIDGADAQWQVAHTLLLGVAGRGNLDLQHGGALRVGDALRIGREGTLTLRDGLLDASLLAFDGGLFNFYGGRVQLTRIEGSLLNQGGTLAPGHSPGRTDITGDYTQGAAGILEIELASATSFDVLAVAGSAHLDGKLVIKLTEDFDAELGSHFDFLLAEQGIVGAFAEVVAPRWNGKRLLLDTSNDKLLRLSVAAVPVQAAVWLLASAVGVVGVGGVRRSVSRQC
jgi:T5SS/PEP-CTERM-associated repeat protein/autotransporter-associated beta strand protein